MILVSGVLYPLLITLISQLTMPFKANGSFLFVDDRIVGSYLIGQKFQSDKYFWGRPSAGNYNPLHSGGSNLGPTSLKLKNLVQQRREHLATTHPTDSSMPVPADLLYASGSGLDPHITLEAMVFQKARVAKARGMDDSSLQAFDQLIDQIARRKKANITGIPYVNVLELNLALDAFKTQNLAY